MALYVPIMSKGHLVRGAQTKCKRKKMKKSKIFPVCLSFMMAATALLGTVACDGRGAVSVIDPPTESVDEERTQLFVFNTDFGVDSSWLMEAKERFETLYENASLEPNKKGVQVVVRNTYKTAMDVESTMLTDREEVYFTQESDYRYLAKKGLLADITEAVTSKIKTGEQPTSVTEPSISDKLFDEQKAYFAIDEMGAGMDVSKKYYAIPYAFSQFGIVYNVELFDKMGYYFAATPNADGLPFVTSENQTKTVGADGKAGTFDDGLPTTYQEFFTLCDYILSKKQTPLTWGGASYEVYLSWLTNALAVDYEGLEQALLQYTFNGEATNLGTIQNATFKVDEQSTQITPDNAYELARSAGNYYALDFTKRLLSGTVKYYDASAFKKNSSQEEARKEFIWKGEDGTLSDVAMLFDGSWWESDATPSFETLEEEHGEACAKENRRFGWMPLPKASAGKLSQTKTITDCLGSMAFIKSNIADWKKPLAEAFLQFIYSEAELLAYVKTTGTLPAVSCTLDDTDVASLTYFGQSLLSANRKAKVLYPYSTAELFVENERFFSASEKWRASFVFASEEQYPIYAFKVRNMSVIDYFNGMHKYRAEMWPSV